LITKEKVTEVRDQLEKACDEVLDMRSTLEGLGGVAGNNA